MEQNGGPGLLSPALDSVCCILCQEGREMGVGRKEGKTLTAHSLCPTPPVSVSPVVAQEPAPQTSSLLGGPAAALWCPPGICAKVTPPAGAPS